METDVPPRRNDLRGHRHCRPGPDRDHPNFRNPSRSRCPVRCRADSGRPVKFSRGRSHCRSRAWTSRDHPRVGGLVVHASADEQGPALPALLISNQPFGSDEPSRRIARPDRARRHRQEHSRATGRTPPGRRCPKKRRVFATCRARQSTGRHAESASSPPS